MSSNRKTNPNQVIKNAREAQDAKQATEENKAAVAPVEPTKEEQAKAEAEATKATEAKEKPEYTRYDREKWLEIIKDKEDNKLTAAQISEKYNVSSNSVYQWVNTFKNEKGGKNKKSEPSSKNMVKNAKKLKSLVDKELEDFDAKVKEAQEFVDNAEEARLEIEAKKEKYQLIIDTLEESK